MPKSKKPNRARATKRAASKPERNPDLRRITAARNPRTQSLRPSARRDHKPPLFPGRTGGR